MPIFTDLLNLNYLAHAHPLNQALVDVLDHIHGGHYRQVAADGDLLEGVDYVFANTPYVATGFDFVVGGDEGE